MHHVLTIAGSDCSGGAGLQADLKVFAAHQVYGMSVVTALTAQNTRGVRSLRMMDPGFVRDQLEAVYSDIRIDAVKIGMLGNAAITKVVASFLQTHPVKAVVLDPVMVSKSGNPLLDKKGVKALREDLIPLATLVTPNLPEGSFLTGLECRTHKDMEEVGARLLGLGAQAALIKGGHLEGDPVDLLVLPLGCRYFPGSRRQSRCLHGTGCSLSSSLAALLARGHSLDAAAGLAKNYVDQGIREGFEVGQGFSPIHHFHPLWTREAAV